MDEGGKVGKERPWVPGYGTVLDPREAKDKAKVAAFAAVSGYMGCVIPVLAAFLPHRGTVVEWWAVEVIAGLIALVGVLLTRDVHLLLRDRLLLPPVSRALLEIEATVVAAGLVDYALGGDHGAFRPIVFFPVLIAAIMGNGAFVAVVWATTVGQLAVTVSLAPAAPAGAPLTVVCFYAAALLLGALLVQQLRGALLRALDGFDRLTEITEVLLRAGGFEEALARFLPLVAVQTEARRVDAYRRDGVEPVLIATWPPVPAGPRPVPTDVFGPATGRPQHTRCSAGPPEEPLTLVVHRRPPRWWDIAYGAALRRVGVELGLLVDHRDFMARLDELGRTDSLTGLANRRELTARLDHELASSRRRFSPFVLAMLDLDHFKAFNDDFGHLRGDEALVGLARILGDRIRQSDLAARFGGEEFCLVLPDTDLEGATGFLEDVLRALARLPTPRPLSCSVGLASSQGHQDVASIIGAADEALYRAKATGRARIVPAALPA